MAKYHKKNNDGIFAAECSIYDGDNYRKSLWSKKKDNIPDVYDVINPFVTKFYATTPESLSHDMKIDDFQQGFGVRFLISSPQYKKPYRKDTALKSKENVDAEIMISQRLKKLHEAIKKMSAVDFTVTVDAMKYYNDLVRETENKFDDMNNSMLSTAFGRSQEHIFKIAMLLEIGKPVNYSGLQALSVCGCLG